MGGEARKVKRSRTPVMLCARYLDLGVIHCGRHIAHFLVLYERTAVLCFFGLARWLRLVFRMQLVLLGR